MTVSEMFLCNFSLPVNENSNDLSSRNQLVPLNEAASYIACHLDISANYSLPKNATTASGHHNPANDLRYLK